MPFSTTFLVRFTAKLTRCLSLALLPALASEAYALSAPQRRPAVRSAAEPLAPHTSKARPYLAALGAMPLRFARPGLEQTPEPPASPEPKLATAVDPASTEEPTVPVAPDVPAVKPVGPDTTAEPVALEPPEPVTQPALPILPDDTKRELRPEDVLPFFRYPNSIPAPGDPSIQVIVPFTPAQPQSTPLPPSSATYQQK